MDKQQQVCSLELSQKLKKLGVKQDSLWFWCEIREREGGEITGIRLYNKETAEARMYNSPDLQTYSAFTVAELGEMMKPHLKSIRKYTPQGTKDKALFYDFCQPLADIDILAKMLIYLLKNGLIPKKQ